MVIHEIKSIPEAKTASRGCPFCGGEGLATIFHAEYQGNPIGIENGPDGVEQRRVLRTMAYCTCLAGQWIMNGHRSDSSDIFKRMHNLIDVITKGSLWSPDDPSLGEISQDWTWAAIRAEMARKPIVQAKPARKSVFGDGPRAKPPEAPVMPSGPMPADDGAMYDDSFDY